MTKDATLVFQPAERPLAEPGYRKASAFDTGMLTKTMRLLQREAGMLGASQVVVQVDGPIRQDGQPSVTKLRTPAVSVFIESRHGPLRYDVDTFNHWECNLRGIALGLEALRSVDRYGVTKRGEQYTGWKALPPGTAVATAVPPMSPEAAAQFLIDMLKSLVPSSLVLSDERVAKSLCRDAAKIAHPDYGGDRQVWDQVNAAKDALDQHHGSRSLVG